MSEYRKTETRDDGAADYVSLAEHYQNGAYADFPQEHRHGGTFGLTIIDARQDAIETVDPAVPEVAFVRGVGEAGPGEVDFGDGWKRLGCDPGWVDMQPAHTDVSLRIPAVHVRFLLVNEAGLRPWLDQLGLDPSVFGAVTGAFRHLPRAAACVDRVWHAAGGGNGWGAVAHEGGGASAPSSLPLAASNALAVDAAFLSLLSELLIACDDNRIAAPVPDVGDRRIARVIDYVEAHIDRSLTLGELADIACVSVFHFGRMFKRITGTTPHRYLMDRRHERAKQMLLTTDLDLTSIALACGYASHSHLSEAFKSRTGIAPGTWRKG